MVTDAAGNVTDPGNLVSGGYLIGLYFFYTIAELCISPVGLSSMSKLAPKRLAGMVMGMWFLGTAIGIYLAGPRDVDLVGQGLRRSCSRSCSSPRWSSPIALFIVAPRIKRMMGKDEHVSSPIRAEVEPEPLPGAKATIKSDD